MNFGKLLVVGMILVIVAGLIFSFSELRNPAKTSQQPNPISYTICPFVNSAYVKEWSRGGTDPESLKVALMSSFNASLDPNYPLAVLQKLVEEGKVKRVYQSYAYSFANCSKTLIASSGWQMDERSLAVLPIREMTPNTKEFDILYGMIYTEIDGKGVVFLYYLSNPETVERVEGISFFYPKNLSIAETTGEIAWRCWHYIENGTEIGTCDGNGTETFIPTGIDYKNSIGIWAKGAYGSFVVILNETVKDEENLPISMRIAVVVNGEGVNLPLGNP